MRVCDKCQKNITFGGSINEGGFYYIVKIQKANESGLQVVSQKELCQECYAKEGKNEK